MKVATVSSLPLQQQADSYRDQGGARISRISAAFQLLILTSADEVMNCHVFRIYLHCNITPEHYCLPSPCLADAPCTVHQCGGILKIHSNFIITKIYTGIWCEPVYRPALLQMTSNHFLHFFLLNALCQWTSPKWHGNIISSMFPLISSHLTVWCFPSRYCPPSCLTAKRMCVWRMGRTGRCMPWVLRPMSPSWIHGSQHTASSLLIQGKEEVVSVIFKMAKCLVKINCFLSCIMKVIVSMSIL